MCSPVLVGWLYGPGLWSTHDGGAHGRRISVGGDIVPSKGGGVAAMAASAGTAYAVVSPDPFNGRPDELFASPVGRDVCARVGRMTGSELAVSGRAAWFAGGTYLWATADGVRWHRLPFRCPGAYYGLADIAAASTSHVVVLCTNSALYNTAQEGIEVLSSADGGRTMHLAGRWAPIAGDGGAIAVPPSRPTVITFATSVGTPSWLGRSADGGKTWKQVMSSNRGAGWSSLSYLTRTVGWVVLGGPVTGGVSQLLRTSDAGAS